MSAKADALGRRRGGASCSGYCCAQRAASLSTGARLAIRQAIRPDFEDDRFWRVRAGVLHGDHEIAIAVGHNALVIIGSLTVGGLICILARYRIAGGDDVAAFLALLLKQPLHLRNGHGLVLTLLRPEPKVTAVMEQFKNVPAQPVLALM